MAAIVHESIGFHLSRREIVGDMHRNLLQAQLLRREQSGVPADDDAVSIDDNRLAPTELLDGGGYLVDCLLGNLAAVLGVTDRFVDRPPTHFKIVHPCTSLQTGLADLSE